MDKDLSARQEWRSGWSLAIACLAGMGVGSIMLYAIGALIAPLEAEFGWSRAQITLGLTVSTLCGALFSPIVGLAVDRWGPRRVALPGMLVLLCAFSLLSFTTDSIFVWLGLWFLLSLGAVGVKPTVWTMAIASSFQKARGLAMAVALCGSSVAAVTIPILATWLVDNYGWRSALPMISVIVGVVVFPILFFWLHSGADTARRVSKGEQAPPAAQAGASVRDALRSPQFVKLALAAFIFTACALGLVSNLIPVMTSLEFSRSEAAVIAGSIGLASLTGRLLTGILLDRFNSDMIAGLCVLLPVASSLLLLNAHGDMTTAIVAIFIFGLSLGAEVDVIAYLAAQKFGTARYGTIFGFITGSWYLATAVGPVLVSLVYDLSGTYEFALQISIPLFVLTSILLFTLGKPLPFEQLAPVQSAARAGAAD